MCKCLFVIDNRQLSKYWIDLPDISYIKEEMGNSASKMYESIRAKVVQQRDEVLEKEHTYTLQKCAELDLSEDEAVKISRLHVYQLVEELNCGNLSSVRILAVVCSRTATIGKQFNLFTQTNFIQAFHMAEACDRKRKESKRKNWTMDCEDEYDSQKYLPPLFGVPISVKDVYDMKGFLTTIGCTTAAKKAKTEDSPIIACFKNSGMIPFVRSILPQLGMTFESNSHLWGRALNPWDSKRTPGGSSGGEGGLISSGCSFLGIGGDIGGSIRIPAIFCGITGIKLGARRISNRYHEVADPAFWGFCTSVPNSLGPLGRCSEDLALFLKVTTTQQFYEGTEDPYTKIVAFNEKLYRDISFGKKKLRVGYLPTLKNVQPSLASIRALDQVKKILSDKGYELVEIEIPNEKQVIVEYMGQFFADGGQIFRKMLNGEQCAEQYVGFFDLTEMWWPRRSLITRMARSFNPRFHDLVLPKSAPMSVLEYQTHMGMFQKYREQWGKYWKSKRIDLLIQPAFALPALQHTKSKGMLVSIAYTYIWNALDMAAGVIPVTVTRDNEQTYESRFDDFMTQDLKDAAKEAVGLPAGIQVIGMPYQEQKILGLMRMLEKEINFDRVKHLGEKRKDIDFKV